MGIGSIASVDKILISAIESRADAVDNGHEVSDEFESTWSVLSAAVLTCGMGEGDDLTDSIDWLIWSHFGNYDLDNFTRFVEELGIERESADWYEVHARYCVVRASKLRAAASKLRAASSGGDGDV